MGGFVLLVEAHVEVDDGLVLPGHQADIIDEEDLIEIEAKLSLVNDLLGWDDAAAL